MKLRIKDIFRGMAFKPVNRQVDIGPVYECITNKLISYKSGEQQTKMANMNLRTNEKKSANKANYKLVRRNDVCEV